MLVVYLYRKMDRYINYISMIDRLVYKMSKSCIQHSYSL